MRFLMSLVALGAASVALAQTSQVSTYDPMQAFVGTWIAKTPGESAPYLVLRLKADNGKLMGTTTHFKMRVIGKGKITGTPDGSGESPLADLKIWGSDLGFRWDADSLLQGLQAKLMVEGTEQAMLVLLVPAAKMPEITKANPGASGFSPVISLRRKTEDDELPETEKPSERWEATFMARLINTAEAQYKFANGHYADYHTLVVSGQLEETDRHEFKVLPEHFHSETNPLPGYRLRLLLSLDASSYQLSIQEKAIDGGLSVFTDETGIVFQGQTTE